MSQYIPNTAIRSTPPSIATGRAAQPTVPHTRSDSAAARPTTFSRPLRCPITSPSTMALSVRPPAVARMTWPIAAPPAGFVVEARAPAGAARPASVARTAAPRVRRIDVVALCRMSPPGIKLTERLVGYPARRDSNTGCVRHCLKGPEVRSQLDPSATGGRRRASVELGRHCSTRVSPSIALMRRLLNPETRAVIAWLHLGCRALVSPGLDAA